MHIHLRARACKHFRVPLFRDVAQVLFFLHQPFRNLIFKRDQLIIKAVLYAYALELDPPIVKDVRGVKIFKLQVSCNTLE